MHRGQEGRPFDVCPLIGAIATSGVLGLDEWGGAPLSQDHYLDVFTGRCEVSFLRSCRSTEIALDDAGIVPQPVGGPLHGDASAIQNIGIRPVKLSITHKFSSDHGAQRNVGEA